MQSILQFDFQNETQFNTRDIRRPCALRHTNAGELPLANVGTIFQLTTHMQELDGSTIDNLGPDQTKVTQIDQMKEKIASKLLPYHFSSTITNKSFACCR